MTEVRDNPGKSRYELFEDGRLVGVACCWFVAEFIQDNPEYSDLTTAGGGGGAPPSGGGRGWGPVRGGEAARKKPEDGASRPEA